VNSICKFLNKTTCRK